MSIRRTLAAGVALALAAVASPLATEGEERPPEVLSPNSPWEAIDLAIVLDTSGSMEWLIDTARTRLWSIVGDLSRLDPMPIVRVAVLTYGNEANGSAAGWVRVETGLTQDLDLVSERLFALNSSGGTEYFGRALQAAMGLDWTPSAEALRMIVVAGNERADQDPLIDLREIADGARREGIFVQTLFCGSGKDEAAETWREFAELVEGHFSTIATRIARDPETPFDAEIVRLSAAVNETFLPLGEAGRQRVESLGEQDRNAGNVSPAALLGRALVKTSRIYSSEWDLVGALEAGKVDLEGLDEEQLPDSLRELSPGERTAYADEMRARRLEIAQQLSDLEEQRRRHLERKGESRQASETLDATVRRTLREKLEEKGFRRGKQ